jgi:hypothetical protein
MQIGDYRTARQVAEWNPLGKRADQSTHGKMGFGTACKEETSRNKKKKNCLWAEGNCVFTKKIPLIMNIFCTRTLNHFRGN